MIANLALLPMNAGSVAPDVLSSHLLAKKTNNLNAAKQTFNQTKTSLKNEKNIIPEIQNANQQSKKPNIIKIKTSKKPGEWLGLNLKASGDVKIIGVEGNFKNGYESYKLTSQEVTLEGDVTFFSCTYSDLTTADMSRNYVLEEIYVGDNPLTDFPACPSENLTKISVGNCLLTALDLTKNYNLKILDCSGNKIKALNLTNNKSLTELRAATNELTSIDLSNNTQLRRVYVNANKLTEIKLGENINIDKFDCQKNRLTAIDLSKLVNLTNVCCYENALKVLDVTNNIKLTKLYCHTNLLKTLDVSKNTLLDVIECQNNELQTIDLSNNKELWTFYCQNNKFKSLDFTQNKSINEIMLYENEINANEMHKIIEMLPKKGKYDGAILVCINTKAENEGNVCRKEDVKQAVTKGFKVCDFNGGPYYTDYEGSDPMRYRVTILPSQHGKVSAEGMTEKQLESVEEGTTIKLIIIPDHNYALKSLTVYNTDIKERKEFKVSGDAEVKAIFESTDGVTEITDKNIIKFEHGRIILPDNTTNFMLFDLLGNLIMEGCNQKIIESKGLTNGRYILKYNSTDDDNKTIKFQIR